jgi:UDP-N-acetylmuramoyl-L-alanyl-D-glutamate--2,6-diaminopimelate ligase
MRPAPGQMQCLGDEPGQPLIVVDEANTPDALEKALQALRSHLRGRLVCVVGCGGETGREARIRKAQAAETMADRVVMTTGTPGNDAPFAIFADAMKGLERPGDARFIEERAEAIRVAIGECGPGDIVLVTGKGQGALDVTGGGYRPRSDEATVREVLEAAA